MTVAGSDPIEEHEVMVAASLRAAGLRVTPQRQAILTALKSAEDHPNADELFSRVRDIDGSVSLATLYRTIAAFEKAGLVRKVVIDESARYELTPSTDHAHMVDVETGDVIEIVSDELDQLRKKIAAEYGYDLVGQDTVWRGRRRR